MKNKFKYFVLYPLMVLIVILTLTYDVKDLISLGVRIPFGEAYWKDSLTNGIVTNKSIRMQPGDSLYYNGVTVTSGTGGGGISGSDNITFSGVNTFTHKNTFSDTLKADGLSLIDNARITSNLNVTGDVISDLNFLKGSSTSIGTISTDSLAFITNNTKRIVINKNGYTNFTDTVQMSDYVQIVGNLNVGTNITALGKVTADSLLGIGYYITDINAANIASGKIDSARIPNTAKIDTANFVRKSASITQALAGIIAFTVVPTVSAFYQNTSRTIQYFLPNSASDTLATISQTQTFTNKTISGSANTITNLKRSIMYFTSNVFSPSDATTYYLGGSEVNSPESSAGIRRVYFPVACTIKACIISCYKGATAGTTENVESYIRLNNTTDYTVTTTGQWTSASGSDQMTNASMTVPISAGDYIEFKIVCPTWSTNPLNCRVSATISIE